MGSVDGENIMGCSSNINDSLVLIHCQWNSPIRHRRLSYLLLAQLEVVGCGHKAMPTEPYEAGWPAALRFAPHIIRQSVTILTSFKLSKPFSILFFSSVVETCKFLRHERDEYRVARFQI